MMLLKFWVSFSIRQIHLRLILLVLVSSSAELLIAQEASVEQLQKLYGIPSADVLVNQSNAERNKLLGGYYWNFTLTSKDTVQLNTILENIAKHASIEGDKNLALEVVIMRLHYQQHVVASTQFELLLKRAETFADKSDSDWFKAILKYNAGNWFLRSKENPHYALYLFLQAESVLINKNEKALESAVRYRVANLLFSHQDFKNAMRYFKVQSIKRFWHNDNNVGVCFQRLGNLDSSNFYFNRALESAFEVYDKDSTAYHVIMGNLGENLFKQKKYEEAIPLLKNDVKISKLRSSWGNASNSLLILAEIYLDLGERATSNAYLIDGRNNARLSQDSRSHITP